MKKKVLLMVLPALLVLSSCQSAPKAKETANLFVEDTLLHEELFGQNGFGKIDTRLHNLDPLDSKMPMIGVQTAPGSVADTTSIRFVAAVNLDPANMEDVHPVWTRVLYEEDGDGTLKSSGILESTKAYTSINSGGDPIYPSDFGSYNRFVVYTMTNIPDTYANCYFNVSLNLAGVPSKVLATKVNLSSHYTFSTSAHDYFLSGKIEGEEKELQADFPTRNENRATFTADFETGDEFYIFHKTETAFAVWNSDCFGDVHGNFTNGTNKLIQYVSGGHMRLYLNNDNPDAHLYTNSFTPSGSEIYVRGVVNGWLDGGANADYELQTDGNDCQGIILDVALPAGDFQLGKLDWGKGQWGYGTGSEARVIGPASDKFSGDIHNGTGNIYCNTAGNYNIMLRNDHKIYIWAA